jgi:hypothetical protein
MLDEAIASQSPETLYHYTSAAGALGIIERGVLWATEASYLNDSSELLYSLEKLKDAWEDEYKKLDELAPVLAGISETIKNRMHGATFITCLCEAKDLLSQWRGYASPGGYAIGFDTRALHKNYVKRSREGILASVSYDAARSEGAAQRWATDAITRWKKEFPRGLVDHIRDLAAVKEAVAANEDEFREDPDGFIRGVLQQDSVVDALARKLFEFHQQSFGYLPLAAAFHKDPAFSAEREWRLVTGRPMTRDGMSQGVRFRETIHGLTPYLEIQFQESPNETPISEIIIGPGNDYGQRERALRMLLLSQGYPNTIEIRPSRVPFRS